MGLFTCNVAVWTVRDGISVCVCLCVCMETTAGLTFLWKTQKIGSCLMTVHSQIY